MLRKVIHIGLLITVVSIISGQYCVKAQEKILRFNHLTTDEGLAQNTVYGIVKDKYGFMWFGTWNGLNRYDGYKFTTYNADNTNPKSLPNNRIISVNVDSAGFVWAMTIDSVILRYNYETDDFKRFKTKELSKSFVAYLNKSVNLSFAKIKTADYEWKGGTNELIQTNIKTKVVTRYIGNIFDKWAVHINNSPWMYFDNNKILWIGTYYNGICYADFLQKPFNFIRNIHIEKEKQPLLDNKVRSICADKSGNLWIGTSEEGISKYSVGDNKSIHFQYDMNDQSKARRLFYLNHIRSVYCDKYGDVWIGSGAGVRKYNTKTNTYIYYWLKPENNEMNVAVRSIMEDFRGDLWICTRYNIQKYDRKTDSFITYYPLKEYGINQPKFRILIEDKNRNFWVSSEVAGLVQIKRDTTAKINEKLSTTIYNYSAKDSNSIIDNCVYHILEDNFGFIWVGTLSGLTRFNPNKKQFIRINKNIGLPDESIMGILNDNHGFIWVSHKKGLTRINAKTLAIKNYTVDDGLLSNEFMENSCYRDNKKNLLYFGSLNGLVYFNPDSMKDNPFPPKIVFTNLQIGNQYIKPNQEINGKIILTKPLYLTQEITLYKTVNNFSIEFAALHFSNPQKNEYKYMLEGFDKNWISTNAQMRFAKYSNLEPRTYFFKVKASNNDGVWNEKGISLKIIIFPPWWETWWFKLFIALCVIFALFVTIKLRISNFRKNQEELAALVRVRTNELEQSNKFLLESKANIQKYAEELLDQSKKLMSANRILTEQQSQIKEQSEELKVHSENLKEANELLITKQEQIEKQSLQMKETNNQLTKLNITKDKLMSIIAHDLKNPFHTLIGFSELLLTKFEKIQPEKIKHFILLMKITASNGYNLLENLLQWSRSQTNRILFEPTLIAPGVIAEEVIDFLSTSAELKNINIKQQIDKTIEIYADENMLRTILRNLIANAIKFTNEKGTITLNLSLDNTIAEISVSDTGIGISNETLDILFKWDSAISTKGTSNEEGTGLGLILCKEFVERHNGKIWVESEVGKGSTFRFTLPLK
jgi:signal transduction histidine kinase/ligand-binding sensor domain-containing protein